MNRIFKLEIDRDKGKAAMSYLLTDAIAKPDAPLEWTTNESEAMIFQNAKQQQDALSRRGVAVSIGEWINPASPPDWRDVPGNWWKKD